ncbi:MAG: helix-turn-helix domain-containing protein [Bdellovibrionaceae bacterium]|nr:helix-turn-helix domain-containing protein [Pseudobdellovibrionaceae bacterium]
MKDFRSAQKLDISQDNQDCSLKTEEWMTTEEAAEYLKIPKASLLNLSSNGKVPYYKFQRRNRYLKSDLLRLLLSNRRGGFNGN